MRIQDIKTKQFSKNGTVTEQRRTDSGTIVSYLIKKDNRRVAIRHRKFLCKLEPDNDPIIDIIDTDLNNTGVTVDDTAGIPRHEETSSKHTGRNVADSDSEKVRKYHSEKSADNKLIGKRRSDRIKGRRAVRKISSLKVQEAHTTQSLGLNMGSSCSSQLAELKKQNQQLKNRITLYESGITDKSLHASQNNFGL